MQCSAVSLANLKHVQVDQKLFGFKLKKAAEIQSRKKGFLTCDFKNSPADVSTNKQNEMTAQCSNSQQVYFDTLSVKINSFLLKIKRITHSLNCQGMKELFFSLMFLVNSLCRSTFFNYSYEFMRKKIITANLQE